MATNPSIHRIIIGTAGHIDHGKSSLVRALTGIDPDRLPEEKDRGLTIDLGFAPLKLQDGTHIGIVDVPGHERFIKNMVAGATSIDFVILVIAADDGVMPQTREHLSIMQLLGVKRGVIALTKIDLVEKDYLDLVEEEIRTFLKGSFLEKAPIFRVAPTQGLGMKAFQQELEKLARETPAHPSEGVFRMPIQRVFSSQGHGTIVTGIPVSGQLDAAARVEILPLGKQGKVRGIQAYKQSVDRAGAGHSTALNLSELDYRELRRGMVAVEPGYFKPAQILEVKLRLLEKEQRSLKHQTAVRVHVGTCEALGKVLLLDRKALAPGEEAYLQLQLEEPIVVAAGDRFVLRLETPPVTVGGGTILSESGKRIRSSQHGVIEELAQLEKSLSDPKKRLIYSLKRRGAQSSSLADLQLANKLPKENLLKELNSLQEQKEIFALQTAELFIHKEGLEKTSQLIDEALQTYFKENPTRLLMDLVDLRKKTKLEEKLLEFALSQKQSRGQLRIEKGKVRPAERRSSLSPEQESKKEHAFKLILDGGFSPPELPEIASKLNASPSEVEKLLLVLVEEGRLILTAGFYFASSAVEKAKPILIENIRTHGELDIPSFRDRLGTSRKYLIPLLEHFDSSGITLRQGGRRILR